MTCLSFTVPLCDEARSGGVWVSMVRAAARGEGNQ